MQKVHRFKCTYVFKFWLDSTGMSVFDGSCWCLMGLRSWKSVSDVACWGLWWISDQSCWGLWWVSDSNIIFVNSNFIYIAEPHSYSMRRKNKDLPLISALQIRNYIRELFLTDLADLCSLLTDFLITSLSTILV